jgi:hypothetical protein
VRCVIFSRMNTYSTQKTIDVLTPHSQSLQTAWDRYFSGLSASEFAAGRQCHLIASEFEKLGRNDLAKMYYQFAIEEEDHGRLGGAMGSRAYPLTETAQEVFKGKQLESGHVLSNRLMVIHSVFEPSALAILGFLNQNADEIFDRYRANIVKACTASVLRDEVGHVLDGAKLIKELIDDGTLPKPSAETVACMKFHLAFVKSGFRSFFSDVPGYRTTINQIHAKFDNYVKQSVATYDLRL